MISWRSIKLLKKLKFEVTRKVNDLCYKIHEFYEEYYEILNNPRPSELSIIKSE